MFLLAYVVFKWMRILASLQLEHSVYITHTKTHTQSMSVVRL